MADLDYLINFDSNTTGIDKSKFAVNKLAGAMAALGVGFGAKELANIADEYSSMAGRINIAVGETGNFEAAMAGVKEVSLATNSNLSATTQLFTKINDAGKELGMTQEQSLDLTKTITQAIQLGGGAAASNEAAIVQLTQSLASGVLRGDEFNSIMEQAPGISKALAASLGVTTGELRAMAGEGKLSAQTVIQALQEQSAAIESDYEKLPLTIGKALQKIQTQWAILIGEFDQDNGASSKVAEWLSALGDSMGMLDEVLADVGEGISWVGDQIDNIDTGTIVAMKQAFEAAYDALKSMVSAVGDVFATVGDNLEFTLGMLFDFNSGLTDAESNTAGFTKAIQAVSVALGFISDGFAGIAIAAKFISGAFYDVAAAFYQLKATFTFGDMEKEAIASMNAMSAQAQKMYAESDEAVMAFKSKGIAAIQELGKTEAQVNAETLANLKTNFEDKNQIYQDFFLNETNYAAQRIALEKQVEEARIKGDTARVNAYLLQIQELTAKDEESAKKQIGLEKAKLEAAQKFAQQAADGNKGVLDSVTLIELANARYTASIDEAGKVSVKAWQDIKGATEESSRSLKDFALTAAKGLGIDVNEALNKVSSAFDRNAEAVKRVADGYGELTAEGLNAGDLLSASLEKLLAGAKSQAEIDEVRKLYIQFGQDGKLSTYQVEMGIDAINGKLDKTPALLDETARAFKELGIISQEEADKQAKAAIANYELVKKSGQANAGQLQEALDGIYGKIKTSGDSTLQTWYNNQAAAQGFSGSLKEVEQSATRATVAIRENTAARKEQSTSTWNAKFANDENTKSESSSLAVMQRSTEVIKNKISALNQLSGTADTTDESYNKLMNSMGFYEGYRWLSMADYTRDMERVQAAVDKQAESYSAKNMKYRRSKGDSAQSPGDNDYDRQKSVNEDRAAQDKRLYETSTEAYQKQWAAIKEASKSLSDADKALLDSDVIPKSMQSMYDKLDRISDEIDREGAKAGKTMQDTANDKKGGYLFDYMGTPNQVKSALSSSNKDVPVKTINVNLKSNGGTVNATIPESQEAMFNAFIKQLQESKALAGQ